MMGWCKSRSQGKIETDGARKGKTENEMMYMIVCIRICVCVTVCMSCKFLCIYVWLFVCVCAHLRILGSSMNVKKQAHTLESSLQAQLSRFNIFFLSVFQHLFSHTPVARFTQCHFQK